MASTHLLCTGKIVAGGEVDWDIAPLPDLEGELQRMIDEAAELQELIDGREDEEWIRRGC